ncbi:MAG: LamG domain-containing protein [Candidatus Micrarchaeia archaeon]
MKRIGKAFVYAILLAILILAYLIFSFGKDLIFAAEQGQNKGTYFNGKEYIQINHTVTGNFTAVLWTKYSTANSLGVMLASGIGENEHSAWYIGDGGEITNKTACGIFSDQLIGKYTAGWRFASIPQLPPGNWYQIACVYNKTAVSLYVDGRLVNYTPTPYTITNSSIIQIGKRTSTFYLNGTVPSFAYFTGWITNVQIYNRALSAKDVAMLYNSGRLSKPISNCSFFIPLNRSYALNGSVPYYFNGKLLYGEMQTS